MLAIVCSAHGFGHLTRQLALAERLRERGVDPVIFSAAPAQVIEDFLPGARRVHWVADVGIAQQDSLSEDLPLTLQRLEQRASERAIEALARRLEPFERVLVDTAPTALEAARRAGVEALAVGNFDWAWIYRHYPELQAWAERFGTWQAPHVGLQLWPGPGLHGFRAVESFGLIGRSRPPHRVPGGVLVSFGGFGLDAAEALLPRVEGLRYVLSPPMPPLAREDCLYLEGTSYPALVAGCDVVLTKPGYGIYAEAALAGTPLVWLPRGAFPEAPFLEEALRARGDEPADLEALPEQLQRLAGQRRPLAEEDLERLAERVLEGLAR